MNETVLDRAHATMTAAPDDDTARLGFFERLGDCELFLLLADEADGDQVTPETFDIGEETVVLVFDREARLAQFVGKEAPYAALSGRALAGMLAEAGLGLMLNPEVAPSSFVLASDGVAWLDDVLQHGPQEVSAQISEVMQPSAPESLLRALDTKLATASGLAQAAYLAGTRTADGIAGHILAFVGAQPGAEAALAKAAQEALAFSGIEAGSMDVGFFPAADPMVERLSRVGLRFEIPALAASLQPGAPGTDPARPPRLR